MPDPMPFEWCKETYHGSVASRCFWYTIYDDGFDRVDELRADDELREIVRLEYELHPLPEWAVQIVRSDIACIPPCGHYSFPAAYLRVLNAIGAQRSNGFNHTCYTADAGRKAVAMDYCLCLDAWLAGASPDQVWPELESLGALKIDWRQVCTELWSVLGQRTRSKELLVERILLQLRFWTKMHVWSDDPASRVGRDQFLGPMKRDGSPATGNGNRDFPAPTFEVWNSPKVQKIDAELAQLLPDWDWFGDKITSVDYGLHPCAPKAFRWLERLIWATGKGQRIAKADEVPDFLCASATYPNQDEAADWWGRFLATLRDWWHGRESAEPIARDIAGRLGERTALKTWLVRLYVRRLELHEQCAEVPRLVHPKPTARRGRKPLEAPK